MVRAFVLYAARPDPDADAEHLDVLFTDVE
jgi:hypothetical protein